MVETTSYESQISGMRPFLQIFMSDPQRKHMRKLQKHCSKAAVDLCQCGRDSENDHFLVEARWGLFLARVHLMNAVFLEKGHVIAIDTDFDQPEPGLIQRRYMPGYIDDNPLEVNVCILGTEAKAFERSYIKTSISEDLKLILSRLFDVKAGAVERSPLFRECKDNYVTFDEVLRVLSKD